MVKYILEPVTLSGNTALKMTGLEGKCAELT
jgi:hypothetical protein